MPASTSRFRPLLRRTDVRQPYAAVVVLVIGALLIAIGVLDQITGVYHLTILYIAPVIIATYAFGMPGGVVTAVIGVAEVLRTHAGRPSSELLQDVVTDFLVFLVVSFTIDRLAGRLATIRNLESRRDSELGIARGVQEAMVGTCPNDERFEIACHLEFVREVGGDYYRFEHRGGDLFLLAADISGKGMSAALFAVFLDDAIREAFAGHADLPSLVEDLNGRMFGSMPAEMFVTLFVARFGEERMSYVNCGHVPPLMVAAHGGHAFPLHGGTAPPLGVRGTLHAEEAKRSFEPGDTLLVVSDGVTESPAITRTTGALESALLGAMPQGSQAVVDSVSRLAVSQGQVDDVTVICVRRR